MLLPVTIPIRNVPHNIITMYNIMFMRFRYFHVLAKKKKSEILIIMKNLKQ